VISETKVTGRLLLSVKLSRLFSERCRPTY
jgi:hypothetical protein